MVLIHFWAAQRVKRVFEQEEAEDMLGYQVMFV
jgi:hypothetical protein